jgi:DNA-binding LacI/PurR family transcriptional regulator
MCGYVGTKRLLTEWHKPVLYFGYSDQVSPEIERKKGYQDALRDAGIEPRDEWVIMNNKGPESGYKTTKKICTQISKPFSILCYSDFIAFGVVKALHELQIDIPGEVAVMGIDGIEFSEYLFKALTTMSIHKLELGQKSAKLLLQIIDSEDETAQQHIIMEPEMIVGQTS